MNSIKKKLPIHGNIFKEIIISLHFTLHLTLIISPAYLQYVLGIKQSPLNKKLMIKHICYMQQGITTCGFNMISSTFFFHMLCRCQYEIRQLIITLSQYIYNDFLCNNWLAKKQPLNSILLKYMHGIMFYFRDVFI